MEGQIIINNENIEGPKQMDIYEKENSSQETSQYEKYTENEDKSSEAFKEHFPQNVFLEEQMLQKKEEKIEEIQDTDNISTYIIKYSRNEEELKEVTDTKIQKKQNCSYMLDLKLVPIENKKNEVTPKGNENIEYYFVVYCHEIAAFYFDEIYERFYTLEDLYKENRLFKIFETAGKIKDAVDEFIIKNQNNKNKFFIEFKDKELKIHIKLSFFDKEQEIIFNIPKKKLNIKEKAKMLPEFLKEIQRKMINLCQENKMFKDKNLLQSQIKELKYNLTNRTYDVNKSIKITKEENIISENDSESNCSITRKKLKKKSNKNNRK